MTFVAREMTLFFVPGDDIRPKVLAAAAKLEHGIDMSPAMLKDVSDNELVKYDRFIKCLTERRRKTKRFLLRSRSLQSMLHP